MNKIYNKNLIILMFSLIFNVIFAQYNYPYSLDPLVGQGEQDLVGSDYINFSWEPPQDDYGLTFYISSIQDNGNGEVSFDISYVDSTYFQPFESFNIAIKNTDANFNISNVYGGVTGELGWTVINMGSNIIFGIQGNANPISANTCNSDCILFTVSGTYDISYVDNYQDEDGNVQPVYVEQVQSLTEIVNSQLPPNAQYQWLPGIWFPGTLINAAPENINCNCNNDFVSCPYACPTPYEYQIYRFTFEDGNNNGQLDEGLNEHLTFSEPEYLGSTIEYNVPYDNLNPNAFTYFEDSGLIPEQGYCYYVTDSHSSLSYITSSYLELVYDQKMCLATDCITAVFYPDNDLDGLGDPDGNSIEQCGAPPGYVPNNLDVEPDCPNIEGYNPIDCAGDCFDWNDPDVQAYQFSIDNVEWSYLVDSTITLATYDQMYHNYCEQNELVRGCAIYEAVETHNSAGFIDEDIVCPDYCALGSTGNELSYYEDVSDYEDNGAPIYVYGGARDCSGECGNIENNIVIPNAWEDECGWCCSCYSSNDPNTPDDYETPIGGCVQPYLLDGENNPIFNSLANECSFFNNGEYGGHMDCGFDQDFLCWHVPDENDINGPLIEDNCGICGGEDACGPTYDIEFFTANILDDNVTIELDWEAPNFYQNEYSYSPDVVVFISDVIDLNENYNGYEVVEIHLGMVNTVPIRNFNIKINSQLLVFYNNEGQGGRAEDIGMPVTITYSNQEMTGNGQIFGSMIDIPIEVGEGLLTTFRAYINSNDCIDYGDNDPDCDVFLGEEFFDFNNDLKFNAGETYNDENGNCKWDRSEDFTDQNNNGIYDLNEPFNDCDQFNDKTICSYCSPSIYGDNYGTEPDGEPKFCSDPDRYHPFGPNGIPDDPDGLDYDDCSCNSVGICILNENIYNRSACYAFYNLCQTAEPEIIECQELEDSDIWLDWDSNTMGDGIWTEEEFYIDLNGNFQYDGPEPFFDYGLDGCPDEYEISNGECNETPNPLLYFDDLNFDNNDTEKNCQYDNNFIDIISHYSSQTSFADINGIIINDYKFLDTEWNKESMNINKVGKKDDDFCYNSVECCEDAYESHYDGQASDCAPLIAYRIKRQASNENNPTTIATLIDNTFFEDTTALYDTEYCYTIDTQVLYDIEDLDGFNNSMDRISSCGVGPQDDCILDIEDLDGNGNPIDYLFYQNTDNRINDDMSPICGINTGCDFTVMYYDGDGDGYGDPDSTQNICNSCFDSPDSCPWIGFQTNNFDQWPDCPNNDVDISPYDCNNDCQGNAILDINGTCCDEIALDICSICSGNGQSCLGIDPPELNAIGNDDNITLNWNEVGVNIERDNNRELLTLSVLEVDDLGFDDDCGTGENGNGEECIGRMVFKIFLENGGEGESQSINQFSIKFNTNGDYALDTIATYFNGTLINPAQVLALNADMTISINESMVFAQNTGTPITGHGALLYIQGTYDLSMTGQEIAINRDPSLTIFLDDSETPQEISHSWVTTYWTAGLDVELSDCGDGDCEGSETYFNCPEDCEGVVNYAIRRDGNILASGIQDTFYVDQNQLVEGQEYCYTVLATSLEYSSPLSNEACASLECTNTNIYYLDEDGDGYGDPENTIEDCILPDGYVENSDDQWPDCSNTEIDVNPFDCIGDCGGDAQLDECGICEGPGEFDQECWSDENLDGCYETLLMVTTCTCEEAGLANEGDGDECEGEQPEPEAPLYLNALGGYHQIELSWQEPDLSSRDSEALQIVVNDIVDNGSGNVILKVNMSNSEPIQSFNMIILPEDIINIDNVVGGSSEEANMDITFYDNINMINASNNGQNIPIGNGLLFDIYASYDISNIGQIIEIEFDNIGFINNLSETVELEALSSSWIIGTGLENTPLYCGDDICDENESLNDSCDEDCNFSYMLQIDNIIVEDDYTELSYLHTENADGTLLGLGEEHCYKIYAKLNEEVVVVSPLVCATTEVNSLPVIISIEDQLEDDGGVVILSIEPIYLDDEPQGYFYEIYRQFNEGPWISVDLFGAYGLDLYTVVTTTVADLTTNENGDTLYNEHNFKVRFLDYESNVVSGYSINNNPPAQVTGLILSVYADILVELDWDSNTELDLGYYSVYSRTENSDWSFIEDTDDSNLLIDIPSEITEFVVTASDTTGNESVFSEIVSTGELSFNGLEIPKEFTLYPAFPNPFNPITNIQYGLPKSSYVKMEIYDIMGRSVVELVNSFQPAGTYEIIWNAENYNSGIYLIRCTSESKVLTQKILLVK